MLLSMLFLGVSTTQRLLPQLTHSCPDLAAAAAAAAAACTSADKQLLGTDAYTVLLGLLLTKHRRSSLGLL